jgi:hypothetical protein
MLEELKSIFKSVTGNYDPVRIYGGLGIVVYTIAAHIFEGYQLWGLHKDFDITAYSLAFPGGFLMLLGGIGGVSAIKDRAMTTTLNMRDSGAIPASSQIPPPQG